MKTLLAFVAAASLMVQTVTSDSFVKTSGTKFTLNSQPFYFEGTNAYYLMTSSNQQVQDVYSTANQLHLPVIRTWIFNLGTNSVWFQQWNSATKTMTINDDASTGLGRMDYVIQQAQAAGIKLILTLNNNWSDYGGMDYYTTNFGGAYHDQFYTWSNITASYKDYISHVLNRNNTLTGVLYKNDPTIFGWELANEPRCGGSGGIPASSSCNTNVIYNWVNEISTYIKSIDSNHLVALGDEGFFNHTGTYEYVYDGGAGVDFDANLKLSNIDFGTVHLYPESWGYGTNGTWCEQWISDHVSSQNTIGKPVILEEYGMSTDALRAQHYPIWHALMESSGLAADAFWEIGISSVSGLDANTIYATDSTINATVVDHAIAMLAKNGGSTTTTSTTTTKTTTGTTTTTTSTTTKTSTTTTTT
ncbi:glycoside hydrolase family 5 protein [Umbelopsis sp. PMI_123]|nr:glycoside hydrolase family 5 protein [Umbelopsis sp. PMI_123]